MKIAALQFSPVRDANENIRKVREMAPEGVELMVLPELADHGYFVDRAFLSSMDLDAFPLAMRRLSAELGTAIAFGAAEREGDAFYDSFFLCENGETLGVYRKMHLTDLEKKTFSPGTGGTLITLSSGLRIAPAICFDLWFPESFREGRRNGADLFAAIGAFGGPMSLSMASARAAENGIPLVLSNRSGSEEFCGIEEPFCGESRIISYFGEVLASAGHGSDEVIVCDIEPGMRKGNVICRDLDEEIMRHEI